MPLFRLSDRIDFPPAWLARSDGLLCIGGDLSPKRLILAYQNGIFPWYAEEEPILWWSPDPRLVLFPSEIHISKSLKKSLRKKQFTIRLNTDFEQTIRSCASVRSRDAGGTWILEEMIDAYIRLHHLGYAHSVETWQDDMLVGGLYGICLGRCFFGESMFSKIPNASKTALVALSAYLLHHEFDLIDCQVTTDHLLSMGAREITRDDFLTILSESITKKMPPRLWDASQVLNY